MPYIYSTATCSGTYVEYEKSHTIQDNKSTQGHNKIIRRVTINGGHGVANKILYTPMGVATKVTDQDFEFLIGNKSFQRHVAAGFLTYDKKKVEPEIKVKDMCQKDGSSPLTPKDFENGENGDETTKVFKGLPKSKV